MCIFHNINHRLPLHSLFPSFNQVVHSIKIKIKNNSKITQNQNQFQNNANVIDEKKNANQCPKGIG